MFVTSKQSCLTNQPTSSQASNRAQGQANQQTSKQATRQAYRQSKQGSKQRKKHAGTIANKRQEANEQTNVINSARIAAGASASKPQ